jgi:hypothetical protein
MLGFGFILVKGRRGGVGGSLWVGVGLGLGLVVLVRREGVMGEETSGYFRPSFLCFSLFCGFWLVVCGLAICSCYTLLSVMRSYVWVMLDVQSGR